MEELLNKQGISIFFYDYKNEKSANDFLNNFYKNYEFYYGDDLKNFIKYLKNSKNKRIILNEDINYVSSGHTVGISTGMRTVASIVNNNNLSLVMKQISRNVNNISANKKYTSSIIGQIKDGKLRIIKNRYDNPKEYTLLKAMRKIKLERINSL